MSQTKISLFEMAEAAGTEALSARGNVERWERDHPNDPLAPTHPWVARARVLESMHLTLSLMALDEDASRKFVAFIIKAKGDEAKLLLQMHVPAPKPEVEEAEAA